MIVRIVGFKKEGETLNIADIFEIDVGDMVRKNGDLNSKSQWAFTQMVYCKRDLEMDVVQFEIIEEKPTKPDIEQVFDDMETNIEMLKRKGIEAANKFNNSTNKILAFWSVTNSAILTTKFIMELLELDLRSAHSHFKEIMAKEG